MAKRKSLKQVPSNPTSPTTKASPTPVLNPTSPTTKTTPMSVLPITSSTPIDSQHEPSKDASKTHENTQYPPIPPPHPPRRSFLDPNLIKLQTISDDLRPYSKSEWDLKIIKKITKPEIYRIILHFNPETKSCPTQLKTLLIDAYTKEVKPLIEHYYLPSQRTAGDAMETEPMSKLVQDFDPLSSKTTCQMLRAAIESRAPDLEIPKSARREGLLWLYKAYVDHDILIPKDSRWTFPPRVLAVDRLKRETIDDLRFALQTHAPHVFVHSVAMVHPVMVSLYQQFVRDEPESVSYKAVEGFHYSIIAD